VEGARPGTVVVDMSSIAPLASREIAAALAERGVVMLDAPVSGGEPKAIEGTLAIMVGGPEPAFDEVKEILSRMGASVTRVGDIGSGNVAKLANQIIVGLNIAAVGEAMVLATRAGVDPAKVFQAIRGGLAGSTVLDAKMPLILAGNFKPGSASSCTSRTSPMPWKRQRAGRAQPALRGSARHDAVARRGGHAREDHGGWCSTTRSGRERRCGPGSGTQHNRKREQS